MDLNLLSLFVEVAKTASFTTAGLKLGLPRSSVSRSIAQLELDLGVQLFNRTTRKVSLSTAGAALYERVLPQLLELRKSIGSLPEREEEPSGEILMTAPTDIGVTFLPEAIAAFRLRHPAVTIDARLTPRRVDLVAEGFDLALRVSVKPLADSSLVARRLSELEMALYAAPSYLARRGSVRTPEDTASHDWVYFRSAMPPSPFPKPVRRSGVTGDDLLFIRHAVRAGLGIGFLPSFLTRDDVASGQLVQLLPRHTVRTGTLYLVYPKGHTVPRKVTAFRSFLLEYLATHPLSLR